MTENEQNKDSTRERLLDAAEELFSENGFTAVSVRAITSKAGCNLAAVNYHFGSKKELYLEVFRSRLGVRAERTRLLLEELARQEQVTIDQVVRTLMAVFLENPFSNKERLRHTWLITRELIHPSEAFEVFAENTWKPMVTLAGDLLGRALGRPIDQKRLRLYVLSIIAQGTYFSSSRSILTRVFEMGADEDVIRMLVDHVTDFTLNGLKLDGE